MSYSKNAGHSPLFIIGVLITILGIVWTLSNVSLRYEIEKLSFIGSKTTQGYLTYTEKNTSWRNYSYKHSYYYHFDLPDGKGYEGMSYGFLSEDKPGQAVTVEYNPENPDESRIEGLTHRSAPSPAASDIFTIFLGLTLAFFGRKKKAKQ